MNTRARIATVCLGSVRQSSIEENRARGLTLLQSALTVGPDLVCLPETFTTGSCSGPISSCAETVPGPTTEAVAKRAKEAGCYVVCPIFTRRDGFFRNSAVVIDRSGAILGIYDKIQPVTSTNDYTSMEGGVTPGILPPPVFDLDFGRVGIQICFDAGFPEGWRSLAESGARLVLWPSAYDGGFSLRVHAFLHQYYVVSSVGSDRSRIIDPLGTELRSTDALMDVIHHDVNLDYTVCHYDFNYSIPERILANYGDRVQIRSDRESGYFLVEPCDTAISVSGLMEEFGFESGRRYHDRHRSAYAAFRDGRSPEPQNAAHADRPQYART